MAGMGRWTRWLVVWCGYYALVGAASAHTIGRSRFGAPLPLALLYAGAGGTVVLTAVWLGVTDGETTHAHPRTVGALSPSAGTALRGVGRVSFFALFVAALGHGFAGRQVAAENLATVFVWPIWLKGVGLLAILFGSPWRVLSPWESLYDLLVALEGEELAMAGSLPSWLGAWPAVVGFVVGIGVVENLTIIIRSPRMTVLLVASYTLVMLIGAVAFGREWFERADTLTVLYGLFARVAPILFQQTETGGYRVRFRTPWAGCTTPVAGVSLVIFVIAAVYTVSFDGFSESTAYQTILFGTRELLGIGPLVSLLVYLTGLLAFVGSFALAAVAVEALATGDATDWIATARAFAPTVVPIAAAYEVAHNYPFVLRNVGQLLTITLEFVGGGGTTISLLGWLSVPVFWGSQVLLIVGGHVVAVVAAHRVAVDRYETLTLARRGHLPLVVVMVGYTVLSLWIVSRPFAA